MFHDEFAGMKHNYDSTDENYKEQVSKNNDQESRISRICNYSTHGVTDEFCSNLSMDQEYSPKMCHTDNYNIFVRKSKSTKIDTKSVSHGKKLRHAYHDTNPYPVWEKSVESASSRKTGSIYNQSIKQHNNSVKKKIASKKKYGNISKKRGSDCNDDRNNTKRDNEIALNSLSQIDRFSRFIFPLTFFLLNVAYWYIYLKRSERIALTFESF